MKVALLAIRGLAVTFRVKRLVELSILLRSNLVKLSILFEMELNYLFPLFP